MKIDQQLFILFGIFFCLSPSVASDTLFVQSQYYHIDAEHRLILINQDISTGDFNEPISYIHLNDTYTLGTSEYQIESGKAYSVSSQANTTYTLFFTKLPIVRIRTNDEIVDEPKIRGQFLLVEPGGEMTESLIGIEQRGGWTQSLEKKSYRIEFWNDAIGAEKIDYKLFDMREDDDWNLQAMCNEPLRVRSKTGFQLWQSIGTLAYQSEEPKAISGVRQEYVELFINDSYNGIYALSELVDRKQLKLVKSNADSIHGELYKGSNWGATTLTSCPLYDNEESYWAGFDYKYPQSLIDWTNLYDLVYFIVHVEDAEFYDDYAQRFDMDNAVDYFIFLNLLRAEDNTGKNVYVARYDKASPYFYVPWDLDGTLGMRWNGAKSNYTRGILWNGMYKRLIEDRSFNGFAQKLSTRWNELRQSVITSDHILNLFNSNYNQLLDNGVYLRENMVWQNCGNTDPSNLEYTTSWLEDRITYLDRVFNNIWMISSVSKDSSAVAPFQIRPNPTSLSLSVFSDFDLEKIEILNVFGQLVFSIDYNLQDYIDVSSLDSGTYLLNCYFKNGHQAVQKLEVIH